MYYGTPCQVRFYEPADGMYHGAIAYHDYLICGCCGAVMKLDDVVAKAVRAGVHWDDAVVELDWVDISGAIQGG